MKIIQNTIKMEKKLKCLNKNLGRPQKRRVGKVSGNNTIFFLALGMDEIKNKNCGLICLNKIKLIFALKLRLWVLVRAASLRGF